MKYVNVLDLYNDTLYILEMADDETIYDVMENSGLDLDDDDQYIYNVQKKPLKIRTSKIDLDELDIETI